MSIHLIENYPDFYKIFKEKTFTWDRTGGDPIKQGNRNPLLYKNVGVDGVKTGYLAVEKYSLASSMIKNDRRVIAVASGFETKNLRSRESLKLLNWGFRNSNTFEISKKDVTNFEIDTWLGNLSKEGDKSDHHVLEALWLRASLRAPDEKLLTRVLNSKEAKSRAAGVRILSHWFNYIKKPYDLLRKTVKDPNPRVRLETVNALREINSLEATNIALTALEMPSDIWLDYGLWMVARESRNHWLPALQSGIEIFNGDPNQLRFALEAAGDSRAISRLVDLLKEIKIDDQNIKNILKTIAGLGNSKELDIALSIATSNPILLDSMVTDLEYEHHQ